VDPFVARAADPYGYGAYGSHLGSPVYAPASPGGYDPGAYGPSGGAYGYDDYGLGDPRANGAIRTSRANRYNPPPAAWAALPPGTPYACKSAYVGRVLPGRDGGPITGCATPARAHPKEGQLVVGDPRRGRTRLVRRTVAKTRMRDAAKQPCDRARDPLTSALDLEQWLAAKAAGERDGTWIPTPPDYDFAHRAGQGRACFYSPAWAELNAFLADKYEEGVEGRDLARAVRKHKKYKTRRALEDEALDEWAARVRGRRVHGESGTREAGRRRADAVRRGEDVGAAEYRDTLARPGVRKAGGGAGGRAGTRKVRRGASARHRAA
jgi:hypothetical protein